jgi:hypothetical protein
MSSSAAAFSRALSPAMESLTSAVLNNTYIRLDDPTDKADIGDHQIHVLHAKIAECRSVDQVIDCVYPDYRPALREHLLLYASWCEKKQAAMASEERLTRSLSAQTIPPRLRVKAPEFQFTKEFGESNSEMASATRNAFAAATASFQEAVNKASLAGKGHEIDFWVEKCGAPELLEKLADLINLVWDSRRSHFKIPTINYDNQGKPTLGDWVISPQKQAERDTLIRASPLFGSQIGEIVAIRHRVMATKIQKKREVAAKADTEMADGTKPGPSIQSLIDKGLNARLKKLNLVPGKAKVSRSYPSSTNLAIDCSNYSELVWPRQTESGPEVQRDFFKGSPTGEEIVYGKRLEEKRECKDGQEEGGQGKSKIGETRSKRKGQGLDRTKTFVYNLHASSIPDNVLDYSWDNAVTLLHLHTPIEFLEASQYRNSVHCSDGVIVPPEISNDLSLGLKYMFFTPPNKNLILQAWNEFQHRLRWRIFFLFKEGVNKPYDPDYSVKRKNNKAPPILPHFMELGLIMGRRYVYSTVSSIPDEKLQEIRKKPFSPNGNKILRFLKDNNYVVTMTDKNLGLAVSERDWLIRNELKLLQDVRNYKELSLLEANVIMKEKGKRMLALSDMVDDHISLSELKLGEYFKSLVTDTDIVYPQFHGLPKIHKSPTGFRPIIPCHSVNFNPAAKFVSKELKPLIKAANSVIHGTKDLFTRLSQLRIDPKRKFFFVTGDVVAFYPNVPLNSCIDIITDMYETWLFNTSVESTIPLLEPNSLYNNKIKLKIFKSAIEIGNTQLVTQHGEKYFLQLNGLAMGVADAPDLANLYGCHFEKLNGILHHPQVVFYGRYIDDCFSIVYAESSDEALRIVSDRVIFDGCVIEWAVSDSQCQFLDATIFKDKSSLKWKPYVKARNNRERIPWVSHHPVDVKRGVYIGELSRLAVICSHKEIYMEAVRDLNALFHLRGYPIPLIMSWCKKNLQERWEKRFALRNADTGEESVLVLKTRFDDVWNWFSATELGNTITKYWEEWYERAETGRYSTTDVSRPFPEYDSELDHGVTDVKPGLFAEVLSSNGETNWVPDLRKIGLLRSRWIVSRKRNTNLFDLANVWKKIVFQQLDENIAQEGGVNPMILNEGEGDIPDRDRPIVMEDEDVILLHRRERSEELEHPEFGRSSKRTN